MEHATDPLLTRAEALADARIKRYVTALTYLAIAAFLAAINWWQVGTITWAFWPALGLALAWLLQSVRGMQMQGRWRDRLLDEELERLRKRES